MSSPKHENESNVGTGTTDPPTAGTDALLGTAKMPKAPRSKPKQSKIKMNFPMKLHEILANKEFEHILSWLSHGRAWRIVRHKEFEEKVIPLYFRHGRYSSFARQVNGWGFRRIRHGTDYNSYYHEHFLRGIPHLCSKMKRVTSEDVERLRTMTRLRLTFTRKAVTIRCHLLSIIRYYLKATKRRSVYRTRVCDNKTIIPIPPT